MALEHGVFTSGKIDNTLIFINGIDFIHHPFTTRQLTQQLTLIAVHIKMLEAVALRGPDEGIGACDKAQVIMQIHPRITCFCQQDRL